MNPTEAAAMTTDQLRDWCAEDDGWHKVFDRTWSKPLERKHGFNHPYPPTLDGAAKAMPDGWTWTRDNGKWRAHHPYPMELVVDDTGDESADRYRLAVMCRIATKEAKG